MSALPDFERHESGARQDGPLATQFALVDFAYQPIISTSTLRVHGFEALARLPDGLPGVCDLLDRAAETGDLHKLDMGLLTRAIGKFARFESAGAARLFCNIDNRSYDAAPPTPSNIADAMAHCGLKTSNLCLEISERGPIESSTTLMRTIELLSEMEVQIALDDFGIGMSGLYMLMTIEPDYVKIDRAFIADIAANGRKQAIVAKLCGLAHALGFLTVAEGIESEADFRTARDLGCDLAQGYAIARPTTVIGDLAMTYGRNLGVLGAPRMAARVAELLSPVEPMTPDDLLQTAAEVFRADPDLRVIPIVDQANMVVGALLEEDVRRYLLSEFGPSLLANKSAAPRLAGLVHRFPIGEAFGSVEAIVNSYVASESAVGLILAADGQYAGYLGNHALLRLAAERAVSLAREQNPLTQLPGNRSIGHHIEDSLAHSGEQTLVFFDFDNFKAFNDRYGFAAGDRALVMFADQLRKLESSPRMFVGHVGGDDFFASLEVDEKDAAAAVAKLCAKFASDAESLYSAADRAAGGIRAIDRFGAERVFPLLRVSASLLHLPASRAHLTLEMVNEQLAAGKRMAKTSQSGIAITRLPKSGAAALRDHLDRRLAG
jgi:diguanylate cyclase (GGDEF)-like protein